MKKHIYYKIVTKSKKRADVKVVSNGRKAIAIARDAFQFKRATVECISLTKAQFKALPSSQKEFKR